MVLVNLLKAFCEANGNPSINSVQLATQIWSMTHGIATLEASQLINLFDRSIEPEALLDHSVRTLLAGTVGSTRLSRSYRCQFDLAQLVWSGILRPRRP